MATIKILDGGLGTSLEDKYGVKFDHSRPLWSSDLLVSDPSTLLSCQRDFAAAGADVVLTATYQVSLEGFAGTPTPDFPTGIPADAVPPFLKTAVDVAEQAAAGAALALSCGPYGACMVPGQEYTGRYDGAHDGEAALAAWHLERLRLYDESFLVSPPGPRRRLQYVAFETLPRLDEIRAVRKAFAAVNGGAFPDRFWIACVFPGDDEKLPDGSTVEQAVEAMLEPLEEGERSRPWGIGINCTKLHKIEGLVRRFEDAVTGLMRRGVVKEAPALVLYPDGTNGEVYNTTTKTWEAPAGLENDGVPKVPWEVRLAEIVQRQKDKAVFTSFLVGGCCKANHENIKALRSNLMLS
ncbi:hypothetical protein RB595_001997 [Gaeumannomyces hyphopodioides]